MSNAQINYSKIGLFPLIDRETYERLKDEDGFIYVDFFGNEDHPRYTDVLQLHRETQEAIEKSPFKGKLNIYVCFNPVKRIAKMEIAVKSLYSAGNRAWAYRTLLTKFRKEIESKTVSYLLVEMEGSREAARRLMFA